MLEWSGVEWRGEWMDRLSYLAPGSWANLRQDRTTEPNRPTDRGGDRESGTPLTSFFRLPRRRRSRRFAPN